MTNSDRPGSGNSSGGSSHHKRNYRHFGPAGSSGQPGGSRPANPENRSPKYESHPDQHREQPGRPQQKNPNQGGQRPPQASQGNKQARGGGNPQGFQQRTPPGQQGNKPIQPPVRSTAPGGPVQQNAPVQAKRPVQQPRETMDVAEIKEQKEIRSFPQQARTEPQAQHQSGGSGYQERPSRWDRKIKTEETYEDVKRDNERIEKEIWLEIAGIHTLKIDL